MSYDAPQSTDSVEMGDPEPEFPSRFSDLSIQLDVEDPVLDSTLLLPQVKTIKTRSLFFTSTASMRAVQINKCASRSCQQTMPLTTFYKTGYRQVYLGTRLSLHLRRNQ